MSLMVQIWSNCGLSTKVIRASKPTWTFWHHIAWGTRFSACAQLQIRGSITMEEGTMDVGGPPALSATAFFCLFFPILSWFLDNRAKVTIHFSHSAVFQLSLHTGNTLGGCPFSPWPLSRTLLVLAFPWFLNSITNDRFLKPDPAWYTLRFPNLWIQEDFRKFSAFSLRYWFPVLSLLTLWNSN